MFSGVLLESPRLMWVLQVSRRKHRTSGHLGSGYKRVSLPSRPHIRLRKRNEKRSTVLKICVYFAPTKMQSLSFVPSLTVLFWAISLVKCAPSSSICPHQPSSSTSGWHQVLKTNQGQVGPSTAGDTHLSNLQARGNLSN